MKLSILICSLEQRKQLLELLVRELEKQVSLAKARGKVEILTDIDRGEKIIGQKRNDLLNRAKGDYIVFIDDDDWVYPCYVKEILKALKTNPDSLAICGHMTTDGANQEQWFISIEHEWVRTNGIYYRFPNHITPVKREHALKVKFPTINCHEDYQYGLGLRGHLKTEVKIEEPVYHYRYSTKNKSY